VNAIGPWDAALVIVKAVSYAATLGASGGVMFLIYNGSLIESSQGARLRRLILALVLMAALASVAKILVTAASMSGDAGGLVDAPLVRMVLQAGEGRAVLVRLVGLLLMGGALAVDRLRPARPQPRSTPPPRPAAPLAALIGAIAAATSFAGVGHVHALGSGSAGNTGLVGASGLAVGSALAEQWLPTLVLALHLSAAAFWLGALMPLLMVARDAEVGRVAAMAARFGAAALYVVGALMAAGACLLVLLLHRVADLWGSDYGRLILAKLLLVAGLLGLAALNHWRLTPRLLAYDPSALRALQRSIRAEIALAGIILFVTAALTTLVGPPALGRANPQEALHLQSFCAPHTGVHGCELCKSSACC
jgi:putative copper export protein